MRVAVLGSWRQQDPGLFETAEAFRAACRQVGAKLAALGHSLIVGSDAEHTADANAAMGAVEALQAAGVEPAAPRIMVIGADSPEAQHPFLELRRTNPGVFVERRVDAASWAAVKLVQTQLADAVILIGGAEKTEQAGLTAAVSRKPLACIGSFGGAAYALNERFVRSPTTWGYKPEETVLFAQLQEPFSELVLQTAMKAAWIEGAPKLMIIHGRSPDRDVFKQYLLQHVGRVIVLADEFAPTDPIPLKFERFAASVDGAIALLTPDDIGGLAAQPSAAAPRTRENVWVEVGWFWGHRGRSKLLLLRKGEVTIPSDLGNVENYEYSVGPQDPTVEPRILQFIERLRAASDVSL